MLKESERTEKGRRPRGPRGGLIAFAQRHAWFGFLALGLMAFVFGSFLFVTGQPPELATFERVAGVSWAEAQETLPGMAEYVSITIRSEAQFQIALSIFLIAVATVPYRKGKVWAWYALWSVPILLVTLGLRVALAGGMGWTLIVFQLFLALGALLLPYRMFFPHAGEGQRPGRASTAIEEESA